jgi:nucleoside-diphosphate-sugar epimerase
LTVRCTGRSAHKGRSLPDFRAAELSEARQVLPLMQGIDTVIHAAGLAHQFGRRKPDPVAFHRCNIVATANVVEAAVAAGVWHVVLVSSVSVYGSHGRQKCAEQQRCQPQGPYAQSKLEAEQQAIHIAQRANLRLTILRMATLYGASDPGNVMRLLRLIDSGRFVWIGNGRNLKSLLHVNDAAAACVKAAVQPRPAEQISIYNVSAGSAPMCEIVRIMASALDRPQPRLRIPAACCLPVLWLGVKLLRNQGWIGRFHSALSKWLRDDAYCGQAFQSDFGFQPAVSLNEGLQQQVEWYRSRAA